MKKAVKKATRKVSPPVKRKSTLRFVGVTGAPYCPECGGPCTIDRGVGDTQVCSSWRERLGIEGLGQRVYWKPSRRGQFLVKRKEKSIILFLSREFPGRAVYLTTLAEKESAKFKGVRSSRGDIVVKPPPKKKGGV